MNILKIKPKLFSINTANTYKILEIELCPEFIKYLIPLSKLIKKLSTNCLVIVVKFRTPLESPIIEEITKEKYQISKSKFFDFYLGSLNFIDIYILYII